MTIAQPDLPLFLVKPGHPNVALLVETLRDAGDWLYASDILARWHTPDTEHNRRFIRALAEAAIAPDPQDPAAPGSVQVISGQRGYKSIGHATADEAHHAAAWLEAQAKKMADRARGIRRSMHQKVG